MANSKNYQIKNKNTTKNTTNTLQVKSEQRWRNERSKKYSIHLPVQDVNSCLSALILGENLQGSNTAASRVQKAQSLFGSSIRRKTARKFLPPFLCTFFPSSVQVPRRLTMTSSTCQKKIIHTLTPLHKLFLVTHFPSRPPNHIRLASAWHSVLFADKQWKVKQAERLSKRCVVTCSSGLKWSISAQITHKIKHFSLLIAESLHSTLCSKGRYVPITRQCLSARTNKSYNNHKQWFITLHTEKGNAIYTYVDKALKKNWEIITCMQTKSLTRKILSLYYFEWIY